MRKRDAKRKAESSVQKQRGAMPALRNAPRARAGWQADAAQRAASKIKKWPAEKQEGGNPEQEKGRRSAEGGGAVDLSLISDLGEVNLSPIAGWSQVGLMLVSGWSQVGLRLVSGWS